MFKINDIVKGDALYYVVGEVTPRGLNWKPLQGGGWRNQAEYTKVGTAVMDPEPIKVGDTVYTHTNDPAHTYLVLGLHRASTGRDADKAWIKHRTTGNTYDYMLSFLNRS